MKYFSVEIIFVYSQNLKLHPLILLLELRLCNSAMILHVGVVGAITALIAIIGVYLCYCYDCVEYCKTIPSKRGGEKSSRQSIHNMQRSRDLVKKSNLCVTISRGYHEDYFMIDF